LLDEKSTFFYLHTFHRTFGVSHHQDHLDTNFPIKQRVLWENSIKRRRKRRRGNVVKDDDNSLDIAAAAAPKLRC